MDVGLLITKVTLTVPNKYRFSGIDCFFIISFYILHLLIIYVVHKVIYRPIVYSTLAGTSTPAQLATSLRVLAASRAPLWKRPCEPRFASRRSKVAYFRKLNLGLTRS